MASEIKAIIALKKSEVHVRDEEMIELVILIAAYEMVSK